MNPEPQYYMILNNRLTKGLLKTSSSTDLSRTFPNSSFFEIPGGFSIEAESSEPKIVVLF